MNLRQGWKQNLIIIAFVALSLIDFVFPSIAIAQNIRISYINTDDYPLIEAGFVATNSDGLKIYNSSVKDFSISENNHQNKILEVINPQQKYQAVSIVVMIDISLSMQGSRLNLVKEGLVDFIDQVPLETSEIAIACFSDESYIYSDFTQNRSKLISAVNRLRNINGTNFNNAFLDGAQGALAISEGGRNKKVILFVTDGLGTTDAEHISDLANQKGATIFTLNLGLPIPKDLESLTHKSGGKHFDRIWNQLQFRSAASAIFRQLECTDYGTIKWLSKLDCEATKPVQLKYKDALLEFDYEVPSDKIGKIVINPSLIQFGAGKVGLEQSQSLSITPQNIPITIKSLGIDTASVFKISDSIQYPINLKPGEPFNTKVRFLAPEAGLYGSNMKITFEECPENQVNLRAGGEEQIRLIFPKGGEVFAVGEDTSIIWDGVKRTQPVEIAYRLTEKDIWHIIDKANNLKYLWSLPNDTSSKVQVKITPNKLVDENMEISAIIDGNTSPVLNSFFSPDGNTIITTDEKGFVKTWNTESGKTIASLGGYDTKKAIIAPDNERILLFLKDETFVWNPQTIKLEGRVTRIGKKVTTSFILPDRNEILIGGNVSVDPANNAKIWSGISSFKTLIFNQQDIKWASFSPDGKLTVTLDSKNNVKVFRTDSALLIHTFTFKETISEIIISPDGTKALLKFPHELCMLDLITLNELYRIPNLRYQQFTDAGKFLLVEEINKSRKFIDSSTGKCALTLSLTKSFEVSPLSGFVIFSRQDSVYLFDLNNQKYILTLPHKPIRLAKFDASESKVYLLRLNNTVEIYETRTGAFLGVIEGFSRKIKEMSFNPVKTQIAFLMEDNRLEIWSPSTNVIMKDAVSGNFTLASPKPGVIDTIQFNEQVINSIKELNIRKFALNSTKFPLSIKQIEVTGKDASEFEVVSKIFPQKIGSNSQLDQEFRFKPTKTGIREARVLTYTHTDTFSTVILGRGIKQKVLPLLRHLDFGKVKVGLHKDTLAPVLVNIGEDSILIRKIMNIGPDENQFHILSNQEYKIAPNDTLIVKVRFNPISRGKTTTALTLTPSAEENRVILRGEGIATREIILTGITRNSADSIPIDAKVRKTDLDADRIMEEQTTGTDGRFKFKLLADRNFGFTADKENFISTSLNIDLREKVTTDTVKHDIYLTEIKPGAIIRFNCIFFEFDKATLLPGSQSDLKRLLDVIQKYKLNSFEIHGHTDSKGPDTYNLNLAKGRATSVMNYLIKNGVSKDRLSIRFFGESKPVADNSTEEGRTLNRRVELKVVK